MKIQILGTGCPKCKQLTQHAEEAVKALGLDAEIEKVTQINDILKFGIMITPAVAIDGVVKSVGKLLSVEEMKGLLK